MLPADAVNCRRKTIAGEQLILGGSSSLSTDAINGSALCRVPTSAAPPRSRELAYEFVLGRVVSDPRQLRPLPPPIVRSV